MNHDVHICNNKPQSHLATSKSWCAKCSLSLLISAKAGGPCAARFWATDESSVTDGEEAPEAASSRRSDGVERVRTWLTADDRG